MKKLLSLLLALVMVFGLVACGTAETPDTTPATEPSVEATAAPTEEEVVGASFKVVVTDQDSTEATFEYTSDAETVGEALLALELIAGDESDYGLYVTSVGGITADWDTEKAYWAFYIAGEYAQTRVDSTEIVAGTTYELVKTVSEA